MIIDCDIHHAVGHPEEYLELLEEPYRSEIKEYGERRLFSGIRFEHGGYRLDSVSADGRKGGFDPHWTAEQLMDRYGHRYGLLTGSNANISGNPDPDYTAAICRAFNDYTIKYWLPADERFRMGITVPVQDPALAVREIERLAGHPKVICILIGATAARIPLGNRFFWPIYEACHRLNLPIHLHPSTTAVIANHASMASGMATNYLQSHCALPQFYQSELISLILEGVFEKFPNLKVAFVEGGISWLPHVLWRMDKEYKALRQQAPFLKKLPSDYIRDHVRFSTQPVEEPKKGEHLLQIFDMIDARHTVMYSSDYPHFDFDEPSVLPKALGAETLQRILHDNACEFFNLPQPAASIAEAA